MKLPIGFFDAKMVGDLLQRISDQNRIESFLTNSAFILSSLQPDWFWAGPVDL